MKADKGKVLGDTKNVGWAADKKQKWEERDHSRVFWVVGIEREIGSGTSMLNLRWNCSSGGTAIS